jgi:hypothetical protein
MKKESSSDVLPETESECKLGLPSCPAPRLPVARGRWLMRRLGEVAKEITSNLRFRRNTEHLYRFGPQALGHFLAELGTNRMIRTEIEVMLERYAEIPLEAVIENDAEDWPPNPMTVIDGGKR